MSSNLDRLLQLPTESVISLLQRLSDLREQQRSIPEIVLPRVTLHLRSGLDLTGYVLRVGQPVSATEPVVLLHTPGTDPRRTEDDVAYAGASSIESVTVHDAPGLAPKLPAPSKLQLSRRLHTVQEQLAQRTGASPVVEIEWPANLEEEGLRALGSLLAEVEGALTEVVSDSMGLEAVKAKLRGVKLALAAEEAARWDDGVFFAAAAIGAQGLDRHALKAALEQGL